MECKCDILTLDEIIQPNFHKDCVIIRPKCVKDSIRYLEEHRKFTEDNPPMLTMEEINVIASLLGYERRTNND